jgi:hypothetical protein
MLDTLGIYRRLKGARASESVSREIASVLGEVAESRLATKQDVRELTLQLAVVDSNLKSEIERSRGETLRWIIGMMIAQSALLVSLMKLL